MDTLDHLIRDVTHGDGDGGLRSDIHQGKDCGRDFMMALTQRGIRFIRLKTSCVSPKPKRRINQVACDGQQVHTLQFDLFKGLFEPVNHVA